MARTTGRSGFKLKSGNKMAGSSFKMMGSSSPMRDDEKVKTESDQMGIISIDGKEIVNAKGNWVPLTGDQGGQETMAEMRKRGYTYTTSEQQSKRNPSQTVTTHSMVDPTEDLPESGSEIE